jgi:hypothetical protein
LRDKILEVNAVLEENKSFTTIFREELLVLGPDSHQAAVHLVNGDIGKIGKSLFSRIMGTYLLDVMTNKVVIYDCDQPVFNCAPYFMGLPEEYQQRVVCHRINLREAGSFFDTLTQDVLDGSSVVINLPANGTPLLDGIFKQQSFNPLTWIQEQNITLRQWWMGVPTKDSLSVFNNAVEILKLPSVFVENRREDLIEKWAKFDYAERDRIARSLPWTLQTLELPNYYRPDMEFFEESTLGFIQAFYLSRKTGENSGLTKMQGQRLASWMRDLFYKINQLLSSPTAEVSENVATDINDEHVESGGEAAKKTSRRRDGNSQTAVAS